ATSRHRKAHSVLRHLETMEVTLKTEVEAGASGFSVKGGGNEGIFIKKVLKESPASKIFSLREGDQLLSATVFFDNIKYEDALKILQYSEPYRVQFSLKRKIAVQEDLDLKEPQVTVPSAAAEVDVSLPAAEIQVPGVEVTVETGAVAAEGEKGRFKMPDVKMPSVKLPKVKGPHAQVSLPKADISLPKGQEGEVALQGPEAKPAWTWPPAKLRAMEGTGLKGKLKMPKFDKPKFALSSPKVEAPSAEVSLPSAEVELPSATVTASGEGPTLGLKADIPGAKTEGAGWKLEKPSLKMPKADIKAPKVDISLPSVDVTLPQASVDLQAPEATLGLEGEGPTLGLKADIPGAKTEGAGWKLEKPSLKMPKADIKAPKVDISLPSVDVTLPQASVDLQAPEAALGLEGEVKGPEKEAAKTKDGKFKMPKFGMPSFGWSSSREAKGTPTVKAPKLDVDVSLPQAELQAGDADVTIAAPDIKLPSVEGSLELQAPDVDLKAPTVEGKLEMEGTGLKAEVSLPSAEVELPSATVTASGEGPTLGLKADIPGAKTEGAGWKLEKPSLKMPKADIKAPKAGISLPSVDVTLPQANVDLQAPEAALSLEGEVKGPEKEAVDVSLKEPQVTVPSAAAEVDVSLPAAEIQVPGVEMPDVKMPSVKLPKVKGPHAQVSLPKADISLPKGQEGEVALQGPEAEASLDVAAGKAEGGGMKIHMPKVKVPSVVFSKPTVKAPKLDVDVSLPQAELKAGDADVTIAAPDIKLPSVEGSLELQAPDVDLKAPTVEGKLEMEGTGLKGKLKMPKFDKPKFALSSPKVEAPSAEVSLPSAEVELPSKPSLKMPKADIKAPKVDISLPSVDVTLPQASVDLQAPEAALGLEGEVKGPEKEAAKTKDGKFKMPKFGMPSFGWSSSREAKGTVASEVDVSLKEPQVTVPSAATEVDVVLAYPEVEVPTLDVSLDSSCAKEGEMVKSRTSVFKMPKISLSKSFTPHEQIQSGVEVSVSETICYSLTEETPSVPSESVGTKPLPDIKGDSISKSSKFRIPSIGFSKAEAVSSKIDLEPSLQKGDITLTKYQINLTESQSKIASLADENLSDFEILGEDGSEEQGVVKLDGQTTSGEISLVDTEVTVKIPKFRKPKFRIRSKGKASESDVGSSEESEIARGRITSDVTDPDIGKPAQISDAQLGVKLLKPSSEVALGKGSEKDVSQSKSEVKVPQLKTTVEISDIAVEAPNLEVECG
uniref:PDZ domain-containing protein n=1 Tax=Malurus cyaneus samueli TaxID=2593467 RepID=A0A8C5X5Y4_9PASS